MQKYSQSDFGVDHLVMSMSLMDRVLSCVESYLVLLEEGVCYDYCVLLAKLY